jgi:putative flippase GtrA
MTLALKYAIFAALATALNIAGQDLSLVLYRGDGMLLFSVLVGTAVGLVTKYQLDKNYIFRFQPRDLRHDSTTFILYTGMGLFTTALFWAFEFSFHLLYQDKGMRYLGAILGLALGYLLKYRLDRRFVFARSIA